MEAQLDDEQGMLEQETTELCGVAEAFLLADEEGFEVGALGMGGPSASRALSLPVVNDGPIKQGKEGAVFGDQRIMIEQRADHRLVKEIGRGYHSKKLLLLGEMGFLLHCKRSFAAVKGTGPVS